MHLARRNNPASTISAAPQVFELASAIFTDSALAVSALASGSEQDRDAAVSSSSLDKKLN
jgi:hypothetical protein